MVANASTSVLSKTEAPVKYVSGGQAPLLPRAASSDESSFHGPAGPHGSVESSLKQQPTLPPKPPAPAAPGSPAVASGTGVGSNSGGGGGPAAAGAGGLPGAAHPYRKGVTAPGNSFQNSFTMFMSNDQYGALARAIPY